MNEREYCVYKHTSPTGKSYIGVTSIVPERRWERGHGYKYNNHFWKAICKYGWDNFTHEILYEHLTREQAYSKERDLILSMNTTNPSFGYNMTEGGLGGMRGIKDSEETRRRKSESAKKAWEISNRPRKIKGQKRKRRKGQGQNQRKKPVSQWTKDGEKLAVWSSLCEIEKVCGIPTGKISECCNGKRSSYKGFIWRFVEVEV